MPTIRSLSDFLLTAPAIKTSLGAFVANGTRFTAPVALSVTGQNKGGRFLAETTIAVDATAYTDVTAIVTLGLEGSSDAGVSWLDIVRSLRPGGPCVDGIDILLAYHHLTVGWNSPQTFTMLVRPYIQTNGKSVSISAAHYWVK